MPKQMMSCSRGTKNARDSNKIVEPFCEIKNQTETSADLYFYGDIVSSWWGAWDETDQYPEAIRDFLQEVQGKELNIYINSGGGSVFAGFAIYNMLKRHQAKKIVHVDGVAASIASIIAFAGDETFIPSNAFLMIHKPWNYAVGNSNDFRKMADTLDVFETGIMNVYAEHLAEGVEIETIKKLVDNETWLNGIEAAKYFNIKVSKENSAVAYTGDSFKAYIHVPEAIKNGLKQSVDEVALEKNLSSEHELEKQQARALALAKLNLESSF